MQAYHICIYTVCIYIYVVICVPKNNIFIYMCIYIYDTLQRCRAHEQLGIYSRVSCSAGLIVLAQGVEGRSVAFDITC